MDIVLEKDLSNSKIISRANDHLYSYLEFVAIKFTYQLHVFML